MWRKRGNTLCSRSSAVGAFGGAAAVWDHRSAAGAGRPTVSPLRGVDWGKYAPATQ